MRRLRAAGGVLALAGLVLAGCASTTGGTGQGTAPPPSAPTTASSVPALSPSPPSSAPLSAPASSAAISPVDPPEVCASGGCTRVKSAQLDGGYTVTLYSAAGSGGSLASAVLELSRNGAAVFWHVTEEAIAGDLACSSQPRPNCVVVTGVGAHASVATGYTRQLDKLVDYDEVSSDTPSTDPIDLNGDGLIDVVTAINTYEPSYATGTVYWQTFQSTGTAFESTGCTTAQHTLPAEPTTPLTGTCPS